MNNSHKDTPAHQHTHDHNDHDHAHGNPFLIPFLLILVFAVLEFSGAIWTQSLALLGDAWHMFSDVFALGLAMFAAHRSNQAKASNRQSRAETVASVLNALLMLLVVIWIVIEAIARLQQPAPVAGGYVMVIAFIGLVVNLIVAQRLHHQAEHHGHHDNLNHRAALLHVMGDILGSVAALAAGAVVYFTGWLPIDPILSIVISLLLLGVTLSLIKDIWYARAGQPTSSQHKHH
ncbi:MAG TPA: cation diffusion facilitator family transporter [Methylophilus sp.]